MRYKIKEFRAQNLEECMNVALEIEREMIFVGKVKPYSLDPIIERKPSKVEFFIPPKEDPMIKLSRKKFEMLSNFNNRLFKMERKSHPKHNTSDASSSNPNLIPLFKKFMNQPWNNNWKPREA